MEDRTRTVERQFVVTIRFWPDGRAPEADDVFLAVQDAVGAEGRLAGVQAEYIDARDRYGKPLTWR